MGGISDFFEDIGDTLLKTVGLQESTPSEARRAEKLKERQRERGQPRRTTQFFDPDRGARIAAARREAARPSIRRSFRIDLTAASGNQQRATRGGLTIS